MKSIGAPTPQNSTPTVPPVDSDPSVDELLRWARNPRSNLPTRRPGASLDLDAARRRAETEAAYLEREQRLSRQVAAEIQAGVAA